ncbi:MAG: PEP-CTERM sorting domain-containing protein [Pseudomonadota bacterium]
MMLRGFSGLIAAVLGLALLSLPGQARAVPIDYFFTGTANGVIGGANFNGAAFTLSVWADTDDVVEPFAGVFNVPAMSATIEIAGIGTATITDPVGVFANNNVVPGQIPAVGFSRFAGGLAVTDLINTVQDFSFSTYDLQSAFAQTATTLDCCLFFNLGTDLGALGMDVDGPGTFQATVKGEIPEPASLALFAIALGGLGFMRRRPQRS